jgi:hypothetical protein
MRQDGMAIKVSCNIQGVREFQVALHTFESTLQRYVHAKLVGWAEGVKTEAMRRAPVKTGHLRSSIYSLVKDWVVNIGAEATYALFVELGTRYLRARPYLYPSVQLYLPQLEQVISEAIDAAKAEAGFQ